MPIQVSYVKRSSSISQILETTYFPNGTIYLDLEQSPHFDEATEIWLHNPQKTIVNCPKKLFLLYFHPFNGFPTYTLQLN